jgi:hypothetical protein
MCSQKDAAIMATVRIFTGLGILGVATSTLATALIWLVVSRPLEVVNALEDGAFFGLLNALANLVR